ncbi:hypothetical protein [Pseudomonas sp. NPDC007930]|uniref:hypothetical protein n=1 Tax=Pseudomonas sp. NPDC007930 TaxID=3364417 RepID=UPI0036EB6585
MSIGMLSLSGFNNRALITLCREARRHGRVIHLLARNEQDPLLLTDYAQWVHQVRTSSALELPMLLEAVRALRQRHGYRQVLIIPICEFFNRFILEPRHRQALEAEGAIVPLVDQALYHCVSDKYSFGQLCADFGIEQPRELGAPAPGDFPLVAKPRSYGGRATVQLKPVILADPLQYAAFLTQHNGDDFYLQEFATGASVYLLYHVSRSGQCSVLQQRNLLQQAGGNSMVAAEQVDVDPALSAPYERMLRSVGFHGLIMIEVRCSATRHVMIEANPRPWGPMQLVADAGGQLIVDFFAEHGVIPPRPAHAPQAPASARYFWSGGLVADQRKGRQVDALDGGNGVHLLDHYMAWLGADLLLRDDTLPLYYAELKGTHST